MTDELVQWNTRLSERVDEKVREVERLNMLRRFVTPQLAEAIAAGGDSILASHRREITVLFCDLRGFTSFSETAEPEEVMAVLREFHHAVGPMIFEHDGTIAQFTALAVLLPVVAGQSGNAGAQALAVTMRGLVLREISVRHWPKMVWKESATGVVNGLAVAATAGIGVYLWSGQAGLVWVICLAMVVSMVAAGLSGALVPILLHRFGQDPATASSIILTTVTDMFGFFLVLSFATLLLPRLAV